MVYERLARLLSPPRCVLCSAPGMEGLELCPACLGSLPWNRYACPCCALPLPAAARGPCGRCRGRPPPFRAFAPLLYRSPVDHLVHELKFAGRLPRARLLGGLLARSLMGHLRRPGEDTPGRGDMPQVVLPVPLHPSRLRQRGFDQALELARPVARALALRLEPGACVRLRPTEAQSHLDAGARRANLRGAFAARHPLPERVAVIDDVLTTGATAEAVARALRRAGAREILVWTVARAPGGGY